MKLIDRIQAKAEAAIEIFIGQVPRIDLPHALSVGVDSEHGER
ncbi:MAG: hypothetical protein SPJ97_02280 [Bacteroides sp.]|nr:hypothetical protein [Bacteroides sp.]